MWVRLAGDGATWLPNSAPHKQRKRRQRQHRSGHNTSGGSAPLEEGGTHPCGYAPCGKVLRQSLGVEAPQGAVGHSRQAHAVGACWGVEKEEDAWHVRGGGQGGTMGMRGAG